MQGQMVRLEVCGPRAQRQSRAAPSHLQGLRQPAQTRVQRRPGRIRCTNTTLGQSGSVVWEALVVREERRLLCMGSTRQVVCRGSLLQQVPLRQAHQRRSAQEGSA